MGVEIERKWAPVKFSEQVQKALSGAAQREIVQGYLCTEPVVRVRKDGDSFYLTYKGKGHLQREEYNLPLTESAYEKLLQKCDGILIQKTRICLPIADAFAADGAAETETSHKNASRTADRPAENTASEDLCAEVDIFHGAHEGLLLVEVEFPSLDAANVFCAPTWFGREVTDCAAYSNSRLSVSALDEISKKQPVFR